MKKLIIIVISIALYSCEKPANEEARRCKQCYQVVSDSATGTVLEIKYGTPPSEMKYCDGALDIVEAQGPQYFHSFWPMSNEQEEVHIITTVPFKDSVFWRYVSVSRTQKYQNTCPPD